MRGSLPHRPSNGGGIVVLDRIISGVGYICWVGKRNLEGSNKKNEIKKAL